MAMLVDHHLVNLFPSASPTYYSGDIKSEPCRSDMLAELLLLYY